VTRKQALAQTESNVELINTIFDDLESQVCVNCMYYSEVPKYNIKQCGILHIKYLHTFEPDFGCNKFKHK